MKPPTNNSSQNSNNTTSQNNKIFAFPLPYIIIAILAVVIIFGIIYLTLQSKKETVKIESFAPMDEVPQATNFTITFSKDLVADSLVNVWLDKGHVEFKPAITGKFQWIAKNKLRFYPDALLAPSTKYAVEISPSIAKDYSYSLKGDRTYHIFTTQFKVNSASLSLEFLPDTDKLAKLLSTIEFNCPVQPEEVVKKITLKYKDGSAIPFRLLTTSENSIISLEADEVKRSDKKKEIQLKIKAGLLPIGGNLGLDLDYVKSILMSEKQKLIVERMSSKRIDSQRKYVRIQFNIPVDKNKASRFISVEPSLSFKINSSHHYLDLKGQFEVEKAYKITVRKGLRAIDGSALEKEFSSTMTFRKENIPPQVDFIGKGIFLNRQGNLNLGISTININNVVIEIDKIFENNLVYLLNENNVTGNQRYSWYNLRALGQRIHESETTIQTIPNEEVVTPLNIEEFLKNDKKGIFNVKARYSRERWVESSKWVMATDMGIIAKKAGDDLWVWVNSLTSLNPVANATIKIFSQNNQLLKTALTNSDGLAVLQSYSQLKEEFSPYILTASNEDDLCFIELTKRQISTSDFDVAGGTYLQHGYEAFLYLERGIYRPGETAYMAGIVRGENISVPTSFPVILQVNGPDGKILDEQQAKLNDQGAVEFDMQIPGYAKTGKYSALLKIGEKEEIGRTEFNVEEFVPDRMKVKLLTEKDSYRAGERLNIDIEAVTLFGPPASGRQVQADIEIEEQAFSPLKYKSFVFRDDKKSFVTQKFDLGDQTLDENGKFKYSYQIPGKLEAPSSLRGVISSTVLEPGGRGVSAYRGVIIHPYDTYIGLRKTGEGYATPNKDTEIEFVVLDTDEQPLPNRNLEISFYRIYWHSILKRVTRHGRYQYVSEKVKNLVKKFTTSSTSGINSFNVKPEEYGRYLVVVRDQVTGSSSSISFYASGWGYSPWAMDNADRIELDLDKESYLPGETAEINVRAPFAGKLLLTVERDKIFDQQVYTLSENTATLEIPIKAEYKPNVYISAHLVRSTESLDRDTPVRAFGVTPVNINNEANQLTVQLDSPDEIRPNKELTVNFQIKDFKGRRPYVTIAAVDEGICQLTDFQTPDAFGFFFGKKRLSVESFDIYSLILPEIESTLSSTAGDIEARRKKHLTPVSVTRVKPVAFWSGLIRANRNGRGKAKFKIPQFNGSLRLMVVAFVDNKFGNMEKKVFVREPIVLTPTFPRFVASGDEFIVPVSIYNGTGSKETFKIKLEAKGPVAITDGENKSVQIEHSKEQIVFFNIKAKKTIGKLEFQLTASGGGEKAKYQVEVPLRPPVPFTTLSGSGSLTETNAVSFKFPSDWVQGTVDFSLSISSFPAVKFSRSLQYLLSYPHGCVEQTTSKLFPLLYFKDLAKKVEPELFETNSADYYIEEGITKLENLQLASGAFSYWPEGNYINDWSSVYAAHFLIEARKSGYEVSDRVYKKMIRALRSLTRSYRDENSNSYQTAVYACYVLSLAGKPEKSTILYFKNNALDKLNDFSQYQLAGAFAFAGNLQTARQLLPKTVTPINQLQKRETGRNFNSSIRAKAIMLDILAEVDESNPSVVVLVKMLSDAAAKNGRWHTTQENAFAFLALGKIMKKQSRANYTGTLTIEDEIYQKFDVDNFNFSNKDWGGKKVAISIKGEGTCYYSWRAEGIPSKMDVNEFDNDLIVRRFYLNENGIPVNYSGFKQGDLVIAKITVKPLTENLDNVAIIDMLPAGFEIENPRLQSRKGINWIKENTYHPMYMDIRDDRLILFGNFRRAREETFYYGLRAVTAGNFTLPSIRGEAMYDPVKTSVASSGRIVVGEW
ncbi:Ig-like domain-containing protein [candidate division KSB1 bacterium]|nr:Ig-like domain-containing protein [candidate division KSB1 bacterium]